MEIITVSEGGFCFGVRRAMKLAEEMLARHGNGVTLGPLIHNKEAVERLTSQGLRVVNEIDDIEPGEIAMIRTHGTGPATICKLQERNVTIIDATCPFVARAQKEAAQYQAQDYQVLVLGEPDHPEAIGIAEHTGGAATIVGSPADLAGLKLKRKIAVICQTTQRLDTLQALVHELLPLVSELCVLNTICDATSKRQEASVSVARDVDLMIVIGGKHSANTTRLAQICAETGTATHHIETAAELQGEWLEGAQRVGLTAGASTPDWVIDEVVERLRQLSP